MAETVWKEVYSSNVNRVGYAAETSEFYVEWQSGKTSVYSGVPADLADQVSRNWSVGGMIASDIKGKFPHRYA